MKPNRPYTPGPDEGRWRARDRDDVDGLNEPGNRPAAAAADCVVIATDHGCHDYADIVARAKLVFDTRGVTRGLRGDNIVRLGE